MTSIADQAPQDLFSTWSATASRPDPRAIMIVAPITAVSTPLKAAIEWQFPWLHVESVEGITALLGEGKAPIQLLLVDLSFAAQLEQCWPALLALYPGLQVAFVTDGPTREDSALLYRFDPKYLRGLLSLDVRLDLFLSSLGLVLSGGRHFSAPVYPISPHAPPARPRALGRAAPEVSTVPSPLTRLTKRERQVLSHIAQGTQNKNIAAVLGLSEHTVKIHIHNLISKLRVHNRTEAASIYLREATDPLQSYPLPSHVHS